MREVTPAICVSSTTRAMSGARLDLEMRPALVNGVAGVVVMRDGEP
jgi:hypothetical protein